MELFQQYTHEYQMTINWQLMFECLQDYRKKTIEQSISLITNIFFIVSIVFCFVSTKLPGDYL